MRQYIRVVQVSHDEEEGCACYEDIVIILVNIGKRTGSGLGDCSTTSIIILRPVGDDSPATLTIKCEAAARPITLLRKAIGRTSAP